MAESAYDRMPNASTSSPSGPALQRVRLLERQVDEAVARADLVRAPVALAALPQERAPEPPSTKKISSSAPSRWSGVDHMPGIDLDPLQPDGDRPGGLAEVAPVAGQVAALAAVRLDVVPVGEHDAGC